MSFKRESHFLSKALNVFLPRRMILRRPIDRRPYRLSDEQSHQLHHHHMSIIASTNGTDQLKPIRFPYTQRHTKINLNKFSTCLDVVAGIQSKPMVNSGRQDDEIAGLDPDPNPTVVVASNVEVATPFQAVTYFLVRV